MNKKILIWILALILLSSFASALTNENLLACYSFDEGVDDDTGNYNGTNAATAEVAGLFNDSRDFNITDRITQADLGIQVINGSSWTMIFHANPDLLVNNRNWFGCGSGSSGAGTEMQVDLSDLGANDYFRIFDGNAWTYLGGAGDLTNGVWNNISFVYDGTDMELWVEGVLEDTQTINLGCDSTFYFGAWGDLAVSRHYDGQMDEVKIFNGTLSNADRALAESYNCSQIIGAVTPQTNFTITANDDYFNNTISSFEAVINGTDNYNTTTGQINTTIPNNSTKLYNITITATGYISQTFTNYNVSSNLAANLTLNHTILNVTAFQFNGSQVNTFNVTASSYNSSHSLTTSTTNGVASLNLTWNETYNVTLDAAGFALFNNEKTINSNISFQTANYTNLFLNQTLILNFFDEITFGDVNNVEFELIGSLFQNNYSTTPDNNITLSLIVPDNYIIRYSSALYPQRRYFDFILTPRSFNNLTLYLLNSSLITNVTATVYDDLGNPLNNAVIEVLRYDASSGNYNLVEKAQTNFEGKALLALQLNSEFYKFNILYNNELKLETQPSYIFDTTISFRVTLEDPIAEDFYSKEGIDYTFVFNNGTNNFRLTYSDPTSTLIEQMCVRVKQTTGTSIIAVNESCSTATSGTILVGINPINGSSFAATAYVTFSGEERFLDKIIYGFLQINNTGDAGIFYTVLVMIIFGVIGYALAGASGVLIGTPMPLLLASLIGFVNIQVGIVVFIQLVTIILAYVIGR